MTVLFLKELRSNWRSFRYPAFLLILLFFAILDPLMLKYMNEIISYFATGMEIIMPDPTPEAAFLSYLSDVSQIGIMVLIFMAMGMVAREKENGVTGWLLSKPIGRWQYLAAKLLALYSVIIIGLIACSALAYLYTMSLLGQAALNGSILATICLLVFTIYIATITFTFSTLLKTPLLAGGPTLLLFFLSGIINMLITNSDAANFYPNTLLSLMKPLLESTATAADLTWPMAVTTILILLMILLAGYRFSKMEI
ncbi:MAG: ABC transporter permease [Firmicutes bacterium]|nr:ABC transporter permease [Bacillota bacterium]